MLEIVTEEEALCLSIYLYIISSSHSFGFIDCDIYHRSNIYHGRIAIVVLGVAVEVPISSCKLPGSCCGRLKEKSCCERLTELDRAEAV